MRKSFVIFVLLIAAAARLTAGGEVAVRPDAGNSTEDQQTAAQASLNFGKTLRIDCIFTGTATTQEISLVEFRSIDAWAGRRVNLDKVPLKGNGQVILRVKGADSGEFDTIVYATSFSTLFQEWQATEEATLVRKSFENVFLVPMPAEEAQITIQLFDFHGNICAETAVMVDPDDILIRPAGQNPAPHEWLWTGSRKPTQTPDTEHNIDIAIVAEGYTAEEMDKFMADARTAIESFWAHEPFNSMRDRINFVAVKLPSEDSGVSVPRENDWKSTAVGSQFDTFYSDRYLTTLHLFRLHDALAGIPYEHIIILANTDTYGGGGIYNSYTLTTAGHPGFKPVVVHEFGHSFAGLGDEYYYDDQFTDYYYPDCEPWEPNITTRKDFDAKWKDMVGKQYDLHIGDLQWEGRETVPDTVTVDLLEGGGYMSKGVWRGCEDCRMKTNSYPAFCPVCQRAIEHIIRFYTESLQ